MSLPVSSVEILDLIAYVLLPESSKCNLLFRT